MRGRPFLLLLLALGMVMSSAAPAAAAAYAPGGFRLEASNGYSIHAIAFDGDPRGVPDGIILFVTRKGSGATYFVRNGVQVTETTVSADLGRLGSIDLEFVPSGKTRVESSACNPQPIEVDSGFYEGRIDFEGEEGYTEAHRTRARGEIRLQASLICAGGLDEGFGGHVPGARLKVQRRWDGGHLEFEVTKNSSTRPARFRAEIQERRGDIAVSREVRAEAGAGTFRFDVPLQTAVLRPPPPFAGAALFRRSGRQPGRLHGHLTIDFPGRSDVPVHDSRGSLERWVQNPGHPFRPAARLLRTRS